MKTVFDYLTYTGYLEQRLGSRQQRTGRRRAAAETMGCHPAYLSRVLAGQADLSLEQAHRLNQFFQHSRDEAHYFLLLVQLARAGTPELRQYFREQVESVRAKRFKVLSRVPEGQTIGEAHEATYYSRWYYSAVHILLTIPELQTVEAMAAHLGLARDKVAEVCDFLHRIRLIDYENGRYRSDRPMMHLRSGSPFVKLHHANLRTRAIVSLDEGVESDLHYSAMITLSRKDAERVRQNLLDSLEENLKIIRNSPEEEGYVYCFDLFRVGANT